MRDGKTRKIERPACDGMGMNGFLESHMAKLVVVSGSGTGVEFPLDRERITLGRGPGVDLVIEDSAMSRQHVAIDYTDDGFRIQDLGSTNGVLVDDQLVQVETLTSGSRFEIGGHVFQLVIEEREETPEVYELPCD